MINRCQTLLLLIYCGATKWRRCDVRQGVTHSRAISWSLAGAYTRPLLSSTYALEGLMTQETRRLTIDLSRASTLQQGLTHVHLSAQPEPSSSLKLHETTQRFPQKALMMSWKVDRCWPLVAGGASVRRGGVDALAAAGVGRGLHSSTSQLNMSTRRSNNPRNAWTYGHTYHLTTLCRGFIHLSTSHLSVSTFLTYQHFLVTKTA